ncbi:hypothetical protein GTP38_23250 [Duganella sp. FT94W]|uniref:DNA primase n=1 Tax=Duganella lactea TaxID=2692173 RepID=A0ABW9VI24_9BURK|nr:DUF5906 domain-containing protein [Duganella lactea]MYM37247.1 hypothetical protein [Duganella lactea]
MSDFNAIPQELRDRPQWLVWRFEPNPKGADKKPLKVPYYANGSKRFGTQGDDKDRKRLVTMDKAVAQLTRANSPYTGIGFAFLPGDGLIGVDIDKCIDSETGEVKEIALNAIAGCNSYTEYSPSGTGVHIICSGETETFKSNKIGLEVFAGRQYFTFTGRQYANSPATINPMTEIELDRLRTIVKSNGPGSIKPGSPPPPGAVSERARLEQALSFIQSDEHDIWIKVGMGLFHALGDAGFGLWDYWSSKAANYGGTDECKRRWTSFQRGVRVTEATIYKLGMDGGWKPPRSILPAPIKPNSPPPPRDSGTDSSMPPPGAPPSPPEGKGRRYPALSKLSEGGERIRAGAEAPVPEVAADAQAADFNAAVQAMTVQDVSGLDDVPYGESAPLFAGGEGERPAKEKPKKVYDEEHWAQVERVLKNFVLIYGEDLVWDRSQRMLMKLSAMRTIVQNSDVMKFWCAPKRDWVRKKNIVFDPTETPSPEKSGPNATINLFSGWKMKPKQGTCLKIQTLLMHLVDGNQEMYDWITRWLAYPLRNRGAKMETSIIMHGDEGSGKNFFFEKVVKAIYGEYGYVIGNAQLEANFNDWASMKLFMVADEVVTRAELRQMKGKLKYLISGDSIIINPKGLPEHSERNQMNFVFLSNELVPLALDKTDRRYLVIWTPPALGRDFYVEVAQEIKDGGVEAFFYYLMHEVDMGDFNEHTKPLYNDAKDRLIEKSMEPAERFYREWSTGLLPLPFHTVGVQQLYDAFQIWCGRSGESKYTKMVTFSPQIERHAGEALRKHAVKYEYGHVVKQRTVFLVGAQPEGKSTIRDWAEDACASFEQAFQKYRRREYSGDVEG